jgi:hypothetical protein
VLGKGTQHLGDIVFWQLADARVDRTTLESLWRDAGLDAALLPEEPTAERALKQAVREAQIGQRDRLIRLGLDNEAEIVFAIVRESHDDAGNVTHVQEARVRLDRTSEAINSDVTSHDIVQAVFAGFRTLPTTHTADDVRRAIVKALGTWAAVTLRDGGGIYWVPSVYAAELRRLQGAVEKIGTSRVHILPVHESQDANRARRDRHGVARGRAGAAPGRDRGVRVGAARADLDLDPPARRVRGVAGPRQALPWRSRDHRDRSRSAAR